MNEKLLEKKTVNKVLNYLKNFNSKFSLITLNNTARTAKDAANSLNVECGAIVKSLVFKSINKELYYLCLVSGDKFLSIDKLALIINEKVRKASADEVKKHTGYSIGGVPPIAHTSSPAKIFIDINLKRFNKIYAAAGHPYVVFGIFFEELYQMTNGEVFDFVE